MATTNKAKSTAATPHSMLRMKRSWPGTSTNPKLLQLGMMVERITGRELWSFCLGTADRPGAGSVPKAQDYKVENR